MIFNPFDLPAYTNANHSSIELVWATPQLQDNIPLVILVMAFVVADLLAWHPKGVMRHQLAWLSNTRNTRPFEATAVVYPWLKPLLLLQYFIFFGLCAYSIFDRQMATHLNSPSWYMMRTLTLSLGIPLAWFLFQGFLFRWFCYLFGLRGRQVIMKRCYQAIHIVLAPVSTLIFISILADSYAPGNTLFLLAALFILSQIAFIFNGFKIFCVNFKAFCLIFVYLCTLEIAPLLVIYTKIGGI